MGDQSERDSGDGDGPPSRRTGLARLGRRAAFGLVAAAVAIGGLALLDDELTDEDGGGGVRAQSAPRPGADSTPERGRPHGTVVWDDRVSVEEFDQLALGMTVQEAGATVGGAGTVVHEEGELGSDGHRLTVRWEGTTPGSFATADFEDGVLVGRSSSGL